MALSLLNRLAPKAARNAVARKPITARKYSSHAHEVGAIEKRVLKTRVVFPSPLGRSNVTGQDIQVAISQELEQNASISPEKQQGTVASDRSTDSRSSRGPSAPILTSFDNLN